MKKPRTTMTVALLVVGLLAATFALRGLPARFLARDWEQQLATVPDEHVALLLSEAARLGEAGIPVLAEALGSPRPSVAAAGRRVLRDELDRWETLSSASASRRLVALADALAARVDSYGPDARREAARIATRILLCPLDPRAVDPADVVASCDRIFRAASQLVLANSQVQEPAEDSVERSAEARLAPPASPANPNLTGLPGGGLPVDSASSFSDAAADQPQRLANSIRARLLRPSEPVTSRKQQADESESAEDQTSRVVPNTPLSLSTAARYQTPASDLPSGDLRKTDTAELLRRYGTGDAFAVESARGELKRRGFGAAHFELARQLFDPDPRVRRRLVRALPGLQSVNAEPWLLLLSHDADAEVRLAAVTLIATTGDPVLLERIEQIAREDPDPRIQRQASQLAKLRAEEK